ncbi:MAG TPA: cytochrome c biogenesis protein CcsA [Spirochaetia bacterium]|nr:cytochrome c biogenesis protein CcsA [Spirochaetia bacterium]
MMQVFATTALVLIAASAAVQTVFLLIRGETRDPVSHWALLAACVLLFAVTVERSILIRFPAVTNMYESLVFFSAVICLAGFALRLFLKSAASRFILPGVTFVALALLSISSSPLVPREIQPPIPALQSLWLVLHVTLAFIGEAFFVVSVAAAVVFLAARREETRAAADRIAYSSVAAGYPIFTVGALIFGAVWAEVAWGTWWSWDPKETWSLVTWLVYTACLHTRLVKRLRGTISAVLAIVGFASTIFTFFGVNFLLSSLHGYG